MSNNVVGVPLQNSAAITQNSTLGGQVAVFLASELVMMRVVLQSMGTW